MFTCSVSSYMTALSSGCSPLYLWDNASKALKISVMLTCILDLIVISQEAFTVVYYWHTFTISPPLTNFLQWALASIFNCPLGNAFPDTSPGFSFSCSLSPRVFQSSVLRPASTLHWFKPSTCCIFQMSAPSIAPSEEPESYTQLSIIKLFKTSILKIELPARHSGLSRLPSQHLAKTERLSVWGQPELCGIQTRVCHSSYLPPKFDLLISLRLFFPTFFPILIML